MKPCFMLRAGKATTDTQILGKGPKKWEKKGHWEWPFYSVEIILGHITKCTAEVPLMLWPKIISTFRYKNIQIACFASRIAKSFKKFQIEPN